MCRLMAYLGAPCLLADLVTKPSHSLTRQSYCAKERVTGHGYLNGDGFGIGWYSPEADERGDPTPCVFSSIQPAWNNRNLERLANKIISPLIFAHVRAAYPGIPVSDANCQPFVCGRYMWMHNGGVGGFHKVRRRLLAALRDEVYQQCPSFESDSAICFALFLNEMDDPMAELPSEKLVEKMEATINTISRICAEANLADEESLLNFVVSDGKTVVATRYCNIPGNEGASLYYASGSSFECVDTESNRYLVKHRDRRGLLGIVASEALTEAASDWIKVPRNTMVVMTRYKGRYVDLILVPINPAREVARDVARSFKALASCASSSARVSLQRISPSFHGLYSDEPRHCPFLRAKAEPATVLPPENVPITLAPRHAMTGGSAPVMALAVGRGLLFTGSEDGVIRQYELEGFRRVKEISSAHTQAIFALSLHGGRLYSSSTRVVKTWELPSFSLLSELPHADGDIFALALAQGLTERGPSGGLLANGFRSRLDSGPLCAAPATAEASLTKSDSARTSSQPASCVVGFVHESEREAAGSGVLARMQSNGTSSKTRLGVHKVPIAGSLEDSDQRFANSSESGKVMSNGVATHGMEGEGRAPPRLLSLVQEVPGVASGQSRLHKVRDGVPGNHATSTGHQSPPLSPLKARLPLKASSPSLISRDGFHSSLATGDSVADACVLSMSPSGLVWMEGPRCSSIPSLRPSVVAPLAHSLPSTKVGQAGAEAVLNPADTEHRGHCSRIHALVICNSFLCSGAGDAFVKVWNLETGAYVDTLYGHNGGVMALAAVPEPSRDSWRLLSGSRDNTIRAWDLATFSCITTVTGHADDVLDLATGHKDRFYSLSSDQTVRMWSLSTYKCLRIFLHQGASFLCLACTPAGIVTGSSDGIVRYWETDLQESAGAPGSPLSPSAGGPGGQEELAAGQEEHSLMQDTLRRFVAIQSVGSASMSKSAQEQGWKGARFLMGLLEDLGAEAKLVVSVENTNPVVFGRIMQDPSRLTVTICGHYDVVAASPDGWHTDPFDLTAVDGCLFGRGVSDSKGPIVAILFAIKELVSAGELKVNIVFVLDGMQESGCLGFREAVQANLEWFEGTGLILTSSGAWLSDRHPCLTYGMRGLICLLIEVSGPTKDLHSGSDGGAFTEPMNDLVTVLSNLVDSNNMILIPGFYDDVKVEDEKEAAFYEGLQFKVDEYKATSGLKALSAQAPKEVLQNRWRNPSLSILGIDAAGGSWSLIPKSATARVCIRHVPDQNPARLVERLQGHVAHEFAKLRSRGNSISVEVQHVGDWWLADPTDHFYKAAERAIERQWGLRPMFVREGSTMPVLPFLEAMLGAKALHLPISQASDHSALQNEKLRLDNFTKGKDVIKDFLQSLGA